jgi:hypothetical protein
MGPGYVPAGSRLAGSPGQIGGQPKCSTRSLDEKIAQLKLNYVNRCHTLHLLLRNGDALPVEAAKRAVHVGTGPILVVGLRWPNAPTAGGEEG